jgi:hypothetical protein
MNFAPIYSRAPDFQWVSGYATAANTTADLTAGTIYLAFTAGADGGTLPKLIFRSTPAGTTTKTVARIWINNGSTTGTAANNQLIDEVPLAATASDADDPTTGIVWTLGHQLPAGYRIYVTLGTGSANGWAISSPGGKY